VKLTLVIGAYAHANTRLKAFPKKLADDLAFVQAVADAFGKFSNAVRDAIDDTDELDDTVTSDMLTQIDGETDKHLWFLEAHLRKPR
jgi:starvation-inducible DNA-binding protein